MNKENTLDISWEMIFKVIIAIVIVYILFYTRNILVWSIFAFIISLLFNPIVDFLEKFKMPRVLAALLIYLSVFAFLGIVVYMTAPVFVSEIQQSYQLFPQYFEKFAPFLRSLGFEAFQNIQVFTDSIKNLLENASSSIFHAMSSLFGGFFSAVYIFSLAFFLSLEGKKVENSLMLLFPKRYESYAVSLFEKSEKKVSGWFLTRLSASLFVMFLTYIACLALYIRYPLTLSLLVGVLNFIPYLGPFISGFLLFILTIGDSLSKSALILVIFIIIQAVENHVLTPLISKKLVGLSPVLVILSLAIGGAMWGLLGALLAIPLAGILFEFLREFFEKKKQVEKQ